MAGEIIAGLGALKAAFDLARGLKDIDDKVKRNEIAYDLSEKLMAAREVQNDLVDRVKQLEAQVASFETWNAEKQRYDLVQLYRGPYAYILKPGHENGEVQHALCTNCYNTGFKSILQSNGVGNVHQHAWCCPSCKSIIMSQWVTMAELIKKTREVAAAKAGNEK